MPVAQLAPSKAANAALTAIGQRARVLGEVAQPVGLPMNKDSFQTIFDKVVNMFN